MGHGRWDNAAYNTRTASKLAASGTSFEYDKSFREGKVNVVHMKMDPKSKAGDKSPNAGKAVREAFDVAGEHNNSRPVAVCFDVTGSMRSAPMTLQKKLPSLFGLVLRKGYLTDPQFLFGAIGDEYSDRFPIQAGQFESDNRSDEDLENLILEGGGGGGNHESYALMAYYLAYHTDLDSVKKRDEKGYCFIIGDERLYQKVEKQSVDRYLTDEFWPDPEQKEIDSKQVFGALQEKFEVFFLFCANVSYQQSESVDGEYGFDRDRAYGWKDVLPQERIKVLEDVSAVSETIAGIIGITEGAVGYDDAMADIDELSDDKAAVAAAGKALATVGGGTSVAKGSTEMPETDDTSSGAEKL